MLRAAGGLMSVARRRVALAAVVTAWCCTQQRGATALGTAAPPEEEGEQPAAAAPAAPSWFRHDLFRMGYSAKRGRFLVAGRAFAAGETLLEEKPLSGPPGDVERLVLADARYQELEPAWRAGWRAWGPVMARLVVRNNAFQGKMPGQRDVYLHLSLCAHSCLPNARRFSPLHQLEAIRDIAAGEDITIAYTDWYTPRDRADRWRRLRHWFPECACALCLLPEDETTAERMRQRLEAAHNLELAQRRRAVSRL
jgi:hypothetical protein